VTTYARRTGKKKVSASVSLTAEEIAIAKRNAERADKSWSAYVAELIREDNKKYGKKTQKP